MSRITIKSKHKIFVSNQTDDVVCMDGNYSIKESPRTYSKIMPVHTKGGHEKLFDDMRRKESVENRLDPLRYITRLDSDDEKLFDDDDDDDDEVDEIIPSPMRHKMRPPRSKQVKNVSSNGCSSGLKREIEISSSDEADVVFAGSRASSNNNTPSKSSQSPVSSKTSYSPDSYTIDAKSRKTLDYGSMLNDTIVHFYMNHLMNKASDIRKERIHLFNSFFFSKFKSLSREIKKGEKKISNTAIKQIVARWDKHINIFKKDFLVIPVCDQNHWFLLVIAFAYNIPADEDEPLVVKETVRDESKTYREPAILIFDSMNFSYLYSLTAPIRQIFLNYRWRIERPDEKPRNFSDRHLIRHIQAKVPRQRNVYDCGVHLLHSFERFLADPMGVYKKVMASEDLKHLFAVDTNSKRLHIKTLIPENGA